MSSVVSALTNTNNEFSQALANNTSGSELDKEAFMLLLVTQFQYQDPLTPMEDKEFIAQLAQFSSLEQLMNLNDSMNNLSSVTQGQEMINATSYIGKTVDISGNVISKTTDAETGDVTISGMLYAIGETPAQSVINVYGPDGIVNSYIIPPQAAGTYPFEWDGKTYNGTYAPDGVYEIVPAFTDSDGAPIYNYDMVVEGLVSGVTTDNGITYLTLSDGRNTPLSEVRRVSEPTVISADTSTDEDNSNSSSSSSSSTENANTGETNTTETNTTETNTGETSTAETVTGTATETINNAASSATETINNAASTATETVNEAVNATL